MQQLKMQEAIQSQILIPMEVWLTSPSKQPSKLISLFRADPNFSLHALYPFSQFYKYRDSLFGSFFQWFVLTAIIKHEFDPFREDCSSLTVSYFGSGL